eukprot:TRINITY_DN26099_c0_g1_i1.p1 TRINITY_DN26099_c0_g1~~TRINITY_DN26099_c0_g1_i1.p1  ORF type:complete len:510 (+),score=67.34 TRINITY_DN26099_c0_g1_i1:58-1587(+)
MGAGASASVGESVATSSPGDLERFVAGLDEAVQAKLKAALCTDLGGASSTSGTASRWLRSARTSAPRPTWLPVSGKGNNVVPPVYWATTVRQWHMCVAACQICPAYAELLQENLKVTMYDVSEHFVIPWTKNTGNSMALLLNNEEPVEAKLMISHAWGEDVDECAVAFHSHCGRHKVPDDVGCWFCVFANYQAGGEPGDCGPSIQEQLALDPFQSVISHPGISYGMVVLSTSTAELYGRSWCVMEIAAAQHNKITTKAALSWQYMAGFYENMQRQGISPADLEKPATAKQLLAVSTENAISSSAEDAIMIRGKVTAMFAERSNKSPFELLDDVIAEFRSRELESIFESLKKVVRVTQRMPKDEVKRMLDAESRFDCLAKFLDQSGGLNFDDTSCGFLLSRLKHETYTFFKLTTVIVYCMEQAHTSNLDLSRGAIGEALLTVIVSTLRQKGVAECLYLSLYHAKLLDSDDRRKNGDTFMRLADLRHFDVDVISLRKLVERSVQADKSLAP